MIIIIIIIIIIIMAIRSGVFDLSFSGCIHEFLSHSDSVAQDIPAATNFGKHSALCNALVMEWALIASSV